MSSVDDHTAWLAGLSPWPTDGFGLERITRLLALLGDPQGGLQAIHVVGTNGKSTTTRMCEALLLAEGVRAGSFISPHVERWSERIRVDGSECDLDRALAAVRPASIEVGATQFETLTAAAFWAFRDAGAHAAVLEAGLGGRYDATNVLDRTITVVLTNVGLEHTDVLGTTREAIAREKLAVTQRGCTVVLGEPEWEQEAWDAGAAAVEVVPGGEPIDLATAAAEAFLGYVIDPKPAHAVTLPGRLERREHEIRDGAHNPDGVRWLVDKLRGEEERYTLCVSMLRDKNVDEMLALLTEVGTAAVATQSSNPRVLPARELAALAERHFARVEIEPDPVRALKAARAIAEPVLVTGSLYLLADLARSEATQ